jgi:tripartite-type tricarboxylate transporter receptor subunit TctC
MKEFKKGLIILVFSLVLTVPPCGVASEKEYPNRPINILVGAAPGGLADLGARSLAEALSSNLGQPVVVINKPGAGGYIAGNGIATARPDGYTLGYLQMAPSMPEVYTYFQEAPYTSKDLKPISRLMNVVGTIIVKEDSPWKSFKDMIEHAKNHPGVKVGTHGPGSVPHLLMISIGKTAGVSFVNVPFSGDSPVALAVLGGHIPLGVVGYPAIKGQVESNSAKVLALYLQKRYELLPNIPTLEELGYKPPVYPFFGMFAPKETSDEIIKKLDVSLRKIEDTPSFVQRIQAMGAQITYEETMSFKRSLDEYEVSVSNFLKEMGLSK